MQGSAEDTVANDPQKARLLLGEETQRMGQVLREFSNRLSGVLREQSQMNDKATTEEFKDMVNQARKTLQNTSPIGEGMKTAKDTMMAIILEKMDKTVFEDVDKFSSFVSILNDDIDEIGAGIIEQGIGMCDGTVIEDGLTDFDKKYLWDCVDTFRFNRIKTETNAS